MKPESKAILDWSGLTLKEIADELDQSTRSIEILMDANQSENIIFAMQRILHKRMLDEMIYHLHDLQVNLPGNFPLSMEKHLEEIEEWINLQYDELYAWK